VTDRDRMVEAVREALRLGLDNCAYRKDKQAFRRVCDAFDSLVDEPKDSNWKRPEVTPAFMIYRDGDRFCAVTGTFRNLQESPSGWGSTPAGALDDLMHGKPPARSCETCGRGPVNSAECSASGCQEPGGEGWVPAGEAGRA
jgi:hypothetical protein